MANHKRKYTELLNELKRDREFLTQSIYDCHWSFFCDCMSDDDDDFDSDSWTTEDAIDEMMDSFSQEQLEDEYGLQYRLGKYQIYDRIIYKLNRLIQKEGSQTHT